MSKESDVLTQLKDILERHGYEISAEQYDAIKEKKYSRKYIRKIIGSWQTAKFKAKGFNAGIEDNEQYIEDYKKDSGILESRSRRITTLDDALKHFNVDTKIWEVDRYVINKWEVGAKNKDKKLIIKPLIQIKVWLRRKDGFSAEAIKGLIEELTEKAPVIPTLVVPKFDKEKYLYEIAIADLHFAMYAWDEEVGENYDTDIAETVYTEAIQDLLKKVRAFPIEKIALPTGNDFFHSDNLFNTSTKGTQQDIDSRWQRAFTRGHRLLISTINMLSNIAPIYVPMIPGNHDTERLFYLGEVLDAYYSNSKDIIIDNSPNPRKYMRYGNSLIGYTHGCNEKPDNLPLVMATERKEDWAETECHEWHIGHTHKMKETKYFNGNTFNGISVRVLPTLASADAWHHSKGYVKNKRAAEAYLWEYTNGYSAHFSTYVKSDRFKTIA